MIREPRPRPDPEQWWRKHAPAGHEDAFKRTRDKYASPPTFGEVVTQQVVQSAEDWYKQTIAGPPLGEDWQQKVDRGVRTALRMRRANPVIAERWVRALIKATEWAKANRAMDEILQGTHGRCRQGGVGQWGHIGPTASPEYQRMKKAEKEGKPPLSGLDF